MVGSSCRRRCWWTLRGWWCWSGASRLLVQIPSLAEAGADVLGKPAWRRYRSGGCRTWGLGELQWR